MDMGAAVGVIHRGRSEQDVVVSSMGSAREWMKLGPLHARDFVLVPSAMGHATSLGLGLALAQPARRIIVLSGDGSLLMNLGTLVTIASQAPRNLRVVVVVNDVYEVTGGQPVPAPSAGVDYAGIARGCGWSSVHCIVDLAMWESQFAELMEGEGPTLVLLEVAPVAGAAGPRSPGNAAKRAAEFREALR
jgi:thiamine pyrophosphate-dependent acetolactate synthase large subunit-like protein